jgi:hypothetical protein
VTVSSELLASVHVLKVTLRDVRPAVWRRLAVPSAITLGELHAVLQLAFEWDDDHLHEFEARGIRYGAGRDDSPTHPLFRDDARDEDLATLGRVVPRVGDVLDYTYDFGDEWRHRAVVEAVGRVRPDDQYPACLAGAGLPPEEDTGRTRPGQFGEQTRERINGYLRGAGALDGRDLPVEAQEADPHFTGLFVELDRDEGTECPCGCGRPISEAETVVLPMLHPAPDAELAALAVGSPLVRKSVALAEWLGASRPVTPAGLLRPADAVRAAIELGLLGPSSSGSASESSSGSASGSPVEPEEPRIDGPRVRSAKELTSLHPVWTGCLAAGLVEVRGGKAFPGPGLALWRSAEAAVSGAPSDTASDTASDTLSDQDRDKARDRLENWCALLGGHLRAWNDAAPAGRDPQAHTRSQLLPAGIPSLYAAAGEPVPIGLLALMTVDLDTLVDDEFGALQLLELPALLAGLKELIADWIAVGVLAPAELPPDVAGELVSRVAELHAALEESFEGPPGPLMTAPWQGIGLDPAELEGAVKAAFLAVTQSVEDGAVIQLTPLGRYGLARLLAAHGWEIPRAGECLDVAPTELLDRLDRYNQDDAEAEAGRWIEARADSWSQDAGRVLWSASVKGPEGPQRRAALQPFLRGVGPRVAPLLEAATGDPWLGSISALVLHQFELRPEPAVGDLLWIVIDQLGPSLDDPEDFADELAESLLEEFLARPSGIAAALGVSHPQTREVLKAAAPQLDDPALSAALRKALAGRSGNPARGRAAARGRRPGRR